ncbi:hypothetical protein MJO28_015770 [Puccinia striiformis f. sp. tritici]|uniref:Uncharacterized protein n=1 Tax=Puccinia striiformis f. sp. tritici TaxID=168172 RepID=A0ACC0DPX6_9BASI|nr:hypothetical protein MJO28_015770 [Puccinia striiformis f. sp. tritici]
MLGLFSPVRWLCGFVSWLLFVFSFVASEVLVELGLKSMVDFKCGPSKFHLDHFGVFHHATTLPLVGQLIAIEFATIDQM